MDLSDEQQAILAQYKEIVNMSDDDIARATLESLSWDLEKAIEASDFGGGVAIHTAQEQRSSPSIIELPSVEVRASATNTNNTQGSSSSYRTAKNLSERTTNSSLTTTTSSSSTNGTSSSDSSAVTTTSSLTNGIGRRDDSGSGSSTSLANATGSSPPTTAKSFPPAKTYDSSDDEDMDLQVGEVSHDYPDSDDEIHRPVVPKVDRIPLIPTDFDSISEAMQNFIAVFESRYGINHPHFQTCPLQAALTEAFEAPGRDIMERRPLAVYLHNDDAIAANIFAQNVICENAISGLLRGQFVTWAWDVTQKENQDKLYEWIMQLPSGGDVVENLRHIGQQRYPLLVVLVKERGTIAPVSIVYGQDDPQDAMHKLLEGLDHYQAIKNKDAQEERERIEREQIRQDQMEEYERALAADRARAEAAEMERAKAIIEERERERQEEEKREHQAKLASSLPAEPAENDPSAITIRLRFPDGEQKIRRFRMTEAVSLLLTYVESLGFDNHRIWNSDVPKKDVATLDCSKTFAELKWPRREQITVEEK